VLRQLSPDVLSVKECHFYILETGNVGCGSQLFNPEMKQTTLDQLTSNCKAVGNPCHLLQPAAWFTLSGLCQLAVTHFILT